MCEVCDMYTIHSEWCARVCSSAEQLVLYMKCAELLSSALHTAMDGIKEGKLYPSGSVKHGKSKKFCTIVNVFDVAFD